LISPCVRAAAFVWTAVAVPPDEAAVKLPLAPLGTDKVLDIVAETNSLDPSGVTTTT
jgi:hypothetical protein